MATRISPAKLFFLLFTVPLFCLYLATPASAEEQKKRPWSLSIGGGGGVAPKYSGSDGFQGLFFPFIGARYDAEYAVYFLDMGKAGVTFFRTENVSVSVGLSFGKNRRTSSALGLIDDNDPAVLTGTPKINNDVRYFGQVRFTLPSGHLTASLSHAPITASYDETDRPDRSFNGMTASLDWGDGWKLSRTLRFDLGLGVTWMNHDYADAYYGVRYATSLLPAFEARSGLEEIGLQGVFTYMHDDHWGYSIFGKVGFLMGDARKSPLSESDVQPFGVAVMFYSF